MLLQQVPPFVQGLVLQALKCRGNKSNKFEFYLRSLPHETELNNRARNTLWDTHKSSYYRGPRSNVVQDKGWAGRGPPDRISYLIRLISLWTLFN